ncbi:MAG: hypothetical protein JF614_22815 [Acidobacteria bacterium]|nr:hypothetical protein [Acidobacteriota bacterium]
MVAGSLRRTSKTLLALVLGATFALPARAALTWQPQGPAFQVNTYALSDQLHPAVATDADGNFVALWIDKLRGLFLRRFDAAGTPLTPEIRVDDPPIPAAWLARQDLPRIAMDGKSGGFAIVYSSSDGIWIRRFNAIAQPLDRIGLPYNATGELLLEPDAVYDEAGSLQVVWRATTPTRTFILFQRLDPQGRAVGGASPANEVIAGARRRPRLALDPWSGDVLVTWVDERETGNPDVWARRLDASGQPRGPEFHVDTDNHGNGEAQSAQPLAHGDGGFSVVWSNFLPASPIGATVEVRAQRYDALGTRFGPETLVTGEGADTNPAAAVLDSHGDVLVLWPGTDRHSPDSAVFGRLFDSSWQPLTEAFEVNSRFPRDQTQPAVTVDSQDRFVALWAGGEGEVPAPGTPTPEIGSLGVFGQRFTFGGCRPDDTRLCLNGDRFQVEVAWKNPSNGQTGSGHPVPLTDDTGALWFFGPANLELLVKVLDGRAVNGNFWFYSGALSNVEYTITVTDTVAGRVRTYHNAPGQFTSLADVSAFPDTAPKVASSVLPPFETAGVCAADALCLAGGRFRVEVDFIDPRTGGAGRGQAHGLTADTGAFWFFGPANLELMVKVLDGRIVNGRFWVFFGALSDVAYTLTVTDTETGKQKTYRNDPGTLASRADTSAF